ncbi:trimethylamine methyltransferase family protein [Ruminococcaceae bacterium OttesenSCG-928-I18]|nr:trimethylamine methyltransferase family protein [Ruminococcaceae bacterium OttesenSCG-928-I18]
MKNRVNYKANNTVQFKALTESQCAELVMATEEVMWTTGVEFHHPMALETLKKCGCFVEGIRVRIPPYITERALKTCQKHVVLCNNRTGNPELFLEGNNSYFGSGPGNPFTRDPFTNERQRSSNESIGWATKVLDALPNIDYCMSLGIVQDKPLLVSDRWEFETQLLNTSKPIVNVCTDEWGQKDCIEMAEIVAGGAEELRRHPFMCLYNEPISPGIISEEVCVKVIMGAEKSIPTIFTPCIMAGGTAPATLSGVIVQGLCESLSGLVLSQCTGEGAAYIMGGVFTILDMGSTIFSYGAPELSLMLACLTDIGHYLHLPMFGTCGCTDSSIIDEQAGIEAMLSTVLTSMSGANLNHDIGYSEYGTTSNLDLAVIDNEIIGMARRLTSGIPVDERTLCSEEIEKAGHGGRFSNVWEEYDDEADYIPKNQHQNFESNLISRAAEEIWKSGGSKSLRERANEKVRDIIENYEPEPLSKDIAEKIHTVVENAKGKIPGVNQTDSL